MPLTVYAIVGQRPSQRAFTRARGLRMRLVTAGGMSAVVAECDEKPALSMRAIRGHDALVRRAARAVPAILPARFGTIVESEASVVALIKRWSDDLREALALVDGREQMTLRLFAEAGGVGERGKAGRTGGAGEDEGDETLPGTRYLLRRAQAQTGPAAPELELLREVLKPIVAAERIVRHDHDPLILTACHLIPRGGAAAYKRILRRHAVQLRNRAVVSGPWPPYAFCPELRK
jgi:hypothetical protein